ncbi:MAG TPA: pyruvate, water dikinase regulatory protein [Rhodocyclaceae bacterium]|nr:pyruvate, water dikinase regulatory protein [Rhodocyclaceae bacterium]HNA04933.1 pyruvate, water dikinase regulatory protein [Rhodocyclaceae bacterium]HNC62313.1 pyruvate, water dikinase regulatory protein [Rhodocyclaceae bacterium]HNH99974.1 pyruvate, water dikinase regulatory protein [Rhodocyclaceae bacterium]
MTQTTRNVFFVSDGTGITAETLGHSLLAQFPDIRFKQHRLPFIDSVEKARKAVSQIRELAQKDGTRPIVFSTTVEGEVKDALRECDALFLDLIAKFVDPLEAELGARSTHTVGRFHGIAESQDYAKRIEAINFTLSHDDGVSHKELEQANVILVGVSRSGKTPTSLYLAMQFGVKVANYPLIPEDFERHKLPDALAKFRPKLFGLTISPERLHQVRTERRPNSRYASFDNCVYEIDAAMKLMRVNGIRAFDSTKKSIEEIAAIIMQEARLDGNSY